MRHQAVRFVAVTLSVMLATVLPAQASPVSLTEVIQVIGNYQSGDRYAALRLRAVSQDGNAVSKASSPAGRGSATGQDASITTNGTASPQGGTGTVEMIELGEVNGSICDCGEIEVPGGDFSFPKLPLLALAALPLLFLDFGGDGDGGRSASNLFTSFTNVPELITPTPMPTPTPRPAPIPEPTTLLLIGTGLAGFAARARRRRSGHARDEEAAQHVNTEEAR